MKLTIDRQADALYPDLDDSPAAESGEISPGVILDYNAGGKVVGIEMLYLSKRVSPEQLGRMKWKRSEYDGTHSKAILASCQRARFGVVCHGEPIASPPCRSPGAVSPALPVPAQQRADGCGCAH
jgi:uncharacterized protein YuzE